ncbi:hypothetical protein CXL00_07020 [Stutzerimonas stutzeri]|uniref:Uncharacterized protein n=1 Tax=Stutzerimonas stutzeri TaxID=316 RepID=A0A2N8SW07_STUST|nr:hypothetical protein CXL00_07020 [Stutzerimonas stutzeri]
MANILGLLIVTYGILDQLFSACARSTDGFSLWARLSRLDERREGLSRAQGSAEVAGSEVQARDVFGSRAGKLAEGSQGRTRFSAWECEALRVFRLGTLALFHSGFDFRQIIGTARLASA